MRFLRCLFTDLKRMIINPYFAIGVIALMFLCFSSTAYFDSGKMKEYNVIETFINFRSEDDYMLSAQYISCYLQCGWTEMFITIIAVFPFVNVICDERKSGAKRYYMHRTGMLRYSLCKVISSLICAALLCLVAYLLFTAIVFIMFHSINSMGESWKETDFDFSQMYIKQIVSIILHGIGSAIITLIVTAFVNNKYFCICAPFFIDYLRLTISSKLMFNSSIKGEYNLLAQLITPYSINKITFENKARIPAVIMYSILLLTAAALFYFTQKGRTDNGT